MPATPHHGVASALHVPLRIVVVAPDRNDLPDRPAGHLVRRARHTVTLRRGPFRRNGRTGQRSVEPTWWSFSMLVVVRPAGIAAAITTVSPSRARSASRRPASISEIIS